jgi:two-component system, NtrC family, sensor kinase
LAKTQVATAGLAASGSLGPALAEAYAEAAGVALLAAGGDGALLGYNRELAQLCDVPPHVLERGALSTLIEWLSRKGDEVSLALTDVLSGATRDSGEMTFSHGRTIQWRRVPMRGEPGLVWAFEDVSESRQLAAALMDAANWLRVLELHTEGVLLELDTDARIVGIWGPSREFFEEPDAALEGKSLAEVVRGPEGAALDASVRRVLTSGAPEEHEYALDLHETRRVLTANAVLMPGEAPAPARVTLMIRDVTRRAHMQAQLLQVERLASVGLLAAGVAHEVNNPLAYVLLNLERLRSGLRRLKDGRAHDEIGDLLDALEMSIEGAVRVKAIVRDLKRFSRPEEDQQLPVDLHRALDFAICMAEPETRGRAVLTRDFGAAPMVRASEARLSQIFLNLIINAAHAIPEGSPTENEIHISTGADAHGRAFIEVRDTGQGMSAATARRVFEPFYTTKAEGVGTGLGLTICHGITTALGGQIDVESVPGQGSMFRVLLPAAPEVTLRHDDDSVASSRG